MKLLTGVSNLEHFLTSLIGISSATLSSHCHCSVYHAKSSVNGILSSSSGGVIVEESRIVCAGHRQGGARSACATPFEINDIHEFMNNSYIKRLLQCGSIRVLQGAARRGHGGLVFLWFEI